MVATTTTEVATALATTENLKRASLVTFLIMVTWSTRARHRVLLVTAASVGSATKNPTPNALQLAHQMLQTLTPSDTEPSIVREKSISVTSTSAVSSVTMATITISKKEPHGAQTVKPPIKKKTTFPTAQTPTNPKTPKSEFKWVVNSLRHV